jgi:hypothetical protein
VKFLLLQKGELILILIFFGFEVDLNFFEGIQRSGPLSTIPSSDCLSSHNINNEAILGAS